MASLPGYILTQIFCLGMFVLGVSILLNPWGTAIFGIALLFAASGLSAAARAARKKYLHEKQLDGMAVWSRGLAKPKGRR